MRLGSDVDRLDGLSLLLEDGAGLLVRSRSDLLWETAATVWTTGPGVICPSATALVNSVSVSQPKRSTASARIIGTITNPPP